MADPKFSWADYLNMLRKSGVPAQMMLGHIVDVADTMDACRCWFESQNLPFSNADMIAMTRLILDQREKAKEPTEQERDDG